MKTAIYIEEGIVQLVLTPDNEFERNALSSFNNTDFETIIQMRDNGPLNYISPNRDAAGQSLILRVQKRPRPPAQPMPALPQ